MDSKSLMIGDWILYGDKPVKVLQLSEKGEYDWVKPIPLTPEILEKNGWEVEIACYATLKLTDSFSSLEYYFHESRLRKWWEGVDEWDNHSEVREIAFQCKCVYVHELQHALRLCGLEELADNFKV